MWHMWCILWELSEGGCWVTCRRCYCSEVGPGRLGPSGGRTVLLSSMPSACCTKHTQSGDCCPLFLLSTNLQLHLIWKMPPARGVVADAWPGISLCAHKWCLTMSLAVTSPCHHSGLHMTTAGPRLLQWPLGHLGFCCMPGLMRTLFMCKPSSHYCAVCPVAYDRM